MFPALVTDTRRKGRSAGPLVESSIILPKLARAEAKNKSSTRLEEKLQVQKEDDEFNEVIRLEAMNLAMDSVRSGKNSIYKSSKEFGLHYSTLSRHVEAERLQGTPTPSISKGRQVYLSDEIIAKEKQKTRANDDRLKSKYSDQWLSYFHEVQRENYVGGPGIKPLQLMTDRSARKYRNLIAPDQAGTYDQNVSRAIALEDIYSHLAWVIVLRIWHGYTYDTSSLGREEG